MGWAPRAVALAVRRLSSPQLLYQLLHASGVTGEGCTEARPVVSFCRLNRSKHKERGNGVQNRVDIASGNWKCTVSGDILVTSQCF